MKKLNLSLLLLSPNVLISNENMKDLGRAGGFDLTIRWSFLNRSKFGRWEHLINR
jgi:hypothetical protein